MGAWQILDRRVLLDGSPWYRIEEQRVQLPDRSVISYPRVLMRDYAIVVASTPAADLLSLRMYRHGLEREAIDLPTGVMEVGEDPLAAAQRELRPGRFELLSAASALAMAYVHLSGEGQGPTTSARRDP